MKTVAAALLVTSIVLTATLSLFTLVPLVKTPGVEYTACGPGGCQRVAQYGSLSYELAGFGGLYRTSGEWRYVDGTVCLCPYATRPGSAGCCGFPMNGWVGPAVALAVVVDTAAILLLGFGVARDRLRVARKGQAEAGPRGASVGCYSRLR
jgi:hypothetical protein